MIKRLAWVTAAAARGSDLDEALVLPALAEAGVGVDLVDWDDPAADWAAYDRAVIRSTWDYTERLPEFLAWTDAVAAVTDLRNPPAVVRWNIDKRYLADLAAAGVPVIPTTFVAPGEEARLPPSPMVVKPAIGAGSRDAASYRDDRDGRATAHVERLHARGVTVLVQPLLESVAAEGEWPMLFFGGRFSHAASKRVSLPEGEVISGLFAEETNRSHTATPAEIAVAEETVGVLTERFGVAPAYARVDLVRGDAGELFVMEVELVEPSLFLPWAPGAAIGELVRALTLS